MAMTVQEALEMRKGKGQTSSSVNGAAKGRLTVEQALAMRQQNKPAEPVIQQQKTPSVEALGGLLSKFQTGYDKLAGDYETLFAGRTGGYKDSYIADAAGLSKSYSTERAGLEETRKQIESILNDANDSLDPRVRAQLRTAVYEMGKSLEQMDKGYAGAADFYGSFANEGDYTDWQDSYFRSSKDAYQERLDWYEDSTAQLKVLEDAEKEYGRLAGSTVAEASPEAQRYAAAGGRNFAGYNSRNPAGSPSWNVTEGAVPVNAEAAELLKKHGFSSVEELTARKEALQAEIARYERGEGEWATYDEKTKLQTGFSNLESDRNLARLQDKSFMEGAKKEAEMANIPTFEELAQMDALIYDNGFTMDLDENGQTVAYSSVDGSRLIQDKDGNFHHAMEKDARYTGIDRLGVYLSADSDQKAKESLHGAISTWDNIKNQGIASHWDFLTPEEVSIYYGLKAGSQQEADAYLQNMQSTLNHRYENAKAVGTVEEYEKSGWLNRTRMQGRAIIEQGLSGLGNLVVMVDAAINDKEIDAYSATYGGTRYANAVRGAEARRLEKEHPGKFLGMSAGDLYNAAMSAVDSVVYNAIPVVGTAMTAAAGSAGDVVDKYAQGASQDQIIRSAVANFAIELATESAGFEKLKLLKEMDVHTWTDWLLNTLKQGGTELMEEVTSYGLNTVADIINRKSQSEWAQIWNRHEDNPGAAFGEVLGELLKNGLSGFISGILGGGFGTIRNTARNTAQTRNIGRAIQATEGGVKGLKSYASSIALNGNDKGLDRAAGRLREVGAAEGKTGLRWVRGKIADSINTGRAGKLYRMTEASVREQNKAELAKTLQEKGYSAKQAQQIAEAAVSSAAGWRLTEKQQSIWNAVQNDPDVVAAVKEALTGEDSAVRRRNELGEDFRAGVKAGNMAYSQAFGENLRQQLRESGIPVAEEAGDGSTTPQSPAAAAPLTRGANGERIATPAEPARNDNAGAEDDLGSVQMRDAMQEAYAEGEISEEEYDDYMDALLEQQGMEGTIEEEQLLRERNEAAERAKEGQMQQTQQEAPDAVQQMLDNPRAGQKENTAEHGGERYSEEPAVIDLSSDNVLSARIGNLSGSKKYVMIQNYILEVLQDQPIVLSDGRKAIVDRSDAQHIASRAGREKTPQIAEIKRIIETAQLCAQDADPVHNKFDYFWYYKANVRFDGETFPLYVNVGKAKNDGSLHVYDLTKKLRDTADRLNGLERPVGNALGNGISKVSIRSEIENVKQQIQTVLDGTSVNHAAQMESYTKNKVENPELAQKLYDNLMDSPYAKQFEEYLRLTEELARLDESGASMDRAAQARNDNSNLNGGTDNGTGVLHGSGQRNDRAGAGEPAGGVAGRAGQDQKRGGTGVDKVRSRFYRQTLGQNLREAEAVSSRSRGVKAGTDRATMKVVPESLNDAEMRQWDADAYSKTGKHITFVAGPIEITGKDGKTHTVRGVITDREILVRVDGDIDGGRITKHEIFHGLLDVWEGQAGRERILDGLYDALAARYSREQLKQMLAEYKSALRGIYFEEGEVELSGETLAEMDYFALEEMLADAYAGINGHATGIDEASDLVRNWMRENHVEQEFFQDNGTEQPTGPPAKEHFSYGGEKSKTADLEALRLAKEMQAEGVADETIRQQTGWFIGRDGKWRYEIDDSGMRYDSSGDLRYAESARWAQEDFESARDDLWGHADMGTLEKVRAYNRADIAGDSVTKNNLRNELILGPHSYYFGQYEEALERARATRGAPAGGTLQDYIDHPALFEAYPHLKDVGLRFERMTDGTKGYYNRTKGEIVLDAAADCGTEATLIHEIQHAVQEAEGFARGSSPVYWELRQKSDQAETRHGAELRESRAKLGRIMESVPADVAESFRRYTELDAVDPDAAAKLAVELTEGAHGKAFNEYFLLTWSIESMESSDYKRGPMDLYRNTAGEIEARDAANRRTMTAEERKNTAPYRGGKDVVFANDTGMMLNQSLSDYPYNMRTVIKDYLSAVDQKVLEFVKEVKEGRAWKGKKIEVCYASKRMVSDILNLVGINNSVGTAVLMNTGAVQHIEKRHGVNGEHDNTMRNDQDIARIGYVLNNYDEVKVSPRINYEYKNRDGSASKMLLFSKKINGTYFVIEAVPNTGKIGIVSAYMDKNGAAQVLDEKTPSLNAQNEPATTPIKRVSQDSIDVKERFSAEESETEEKQKDSYSVLPAKARDYVRRAENTLLKTMSEALSVPFTARREFLAPMIRSITNEYLEKGSVSGETVNALFQRAYAQGIVADEEYYRQYEHIKKHLHDTAVTLAEQDRSDIADYFDFKRRAGGFLKIRNEGGLPVDVAYQELQDMAPELFPDHITHPADQLQHMLEVARGIEVAYYSLEEYYGEDAAAHKRDARHEFEQAVDGVLADLRDAKRYMDEKNAPVDRVPTTVEEAMEAWKVLKEARKTYEKAMARNLLTEHDQRIVGDLLWGKASLENLDPKTDNVKGIKAVYEAKREYARIVDLLAKYKRNMKSQLRSEADALLETANEWKDKGSGLAYSRETMRRNVLDIVKDPEVADKILRKYFEPVAVAEAAATRFKDKYRQKVKELDLSRKVKKGDTVSEAHAVQLLGEALDNIDMIEKSRGRLKQRDGKSLTEWKAVVQELWETSPGLDKARIEGAVQQFREIYDDLFQQMNAVRVRNGYEPVNYRNGYFPHFQKESTDGILAHFGRVLGISTEVAALPTTINGLTHTFRPGIQWFGNALQRTGFATAYDAVEGFDKYIEGVASVIHQTDNIQRLRALASQIRYRTSDDGIRAQVDKVMQDERFSEEEKQAQISSIYEHGRFSLSHFVVELDEYTNLLANKKSKRDREIESDIGRGVYNLAKWLEQRVAANMIAGNLSSALTNVIPLTQAAARMDKVSLLQGMWNTLKAYKNDDGMVETSTFLTNRRGSDPLIRNWQDKVSGFAGLPMELIDQFVADSIVRGAYYQNLKKGMTEDEALHQADLFAASVMADRSKGAMPTIFSATNPGAKLFTMFQLEVNNQFSEIFKDVPREMRGKSKWALAAKIFQYVLGAFLFNELFEYLFGRRPALDPIGILNEAVGDFSGYELPNLLELGAGAISGNAPSFETEKQGVGQGIINLGENILGELPFNSALGFVGIGEDNRIPVESALPDVGKLINAATNSEWAGKKRAKTMVDELAKPATYLLPPFGGNQLSKVVKGVIAAATGGSYSVDNKGNDILQYPVYDDPWSILRAAVMGKSSVPEAQDWVDSGFKSFNAKETATYQGVLDVGVDDREAYALISQLRKAQGVQDVISKADVQRQILEKSDVSAAAKMVAYCGMVATDTELAWIGRLMELKPDAESAFSVAVGLNNANDLKGDAAKKARAEVLADSALTEAQKIVAVESFIKPEWLTEKGEPTRYALFRNALEAGLTVDDYMELYAKGVDMDNFFKYTDSGMSAAEAAAALAAKHDLAAGAGTEKVTSAQKWRAVVDSQSSPADQLAALSVEMTESQHNRATVANDYGVTPTKYVSFREMLSDYDADGNKDYNQKEITAAINAVSSKLALTTEQKAVLWQVTANTTSAKNNPYSPAIGQKVVDALQKMKDEADDKSLSFGDLFMKQVMGNI